MGKSLKYRQISICLWIYLLWHFKTCFLFFYCSGGKLKDAKVIFVVGE